MQKAPPGEGLSHNHLQGNIRSSTFWLNQTECGIFTEFPATIITAMVSPTALPMARMTLAMIPDFAARIVTIWIVCHVVAPSARDLRDTIAAPP